MALSSTIKHLINLTLAPFGLRLDTLTVDRQELLRLRELRKSGYFDMPAFPLPAALSAMDPTPVLQDARKYKRRFDELTKGVRNPVGYSLDNPFFGSPDAEVMYSMIRRLRPKTVVEIGCGNSTRLIRLAILDGEMESRIVAIDPSPREDVAKIADQVLLCPVESMLDASLFSELRPGDILSIDSSHELKAGNDLTFLYAKVLPLLRTGVVVHIHDIFLPFDYKASWVVDERRQYTEQYIVHAMLQYGGHFDVLWAGYYLQRTLQDFAGFFPHSGSRSAQSLWLRKIV